MLTYEPIAGDHIKMAANEAVQFLINSGRKSIILNFNEIKVHVSENSTPSDIVKDFYRKLAIQSEKYQNSRRGKQAKKERLAFQKQASQAAAEGIEPFTIIDQKAWDSWVEANKDGYGSCVIRYAARWANLMEDEICKRSMYIALEKGIGPFNPGDKVEFDKIRKGVLMDIADKTSHDADLEGITGFMYGCAVSMLAKCWKYGEELRQWRNLKTQLRDEGEKANKEGGILNPAFLNIGTP